MIAHFNYNPITGLEYHCEQTKEMTRFNTNAIPRHMNPRKVVEHYLQRGIMLVKGERGRRIIQKYHAIMMNGKECTA